MVSNTLSVLGLLGFIVAAAAYSFVSFLVLRAHPGTRQADWLVAALTGSALWAIAILFLAWQQESYFRWVAPIDAARSLVWVLFTAVLLDSAKRSRLARAVSVALGLGAISAGGLVLGLALIGIADGPTIRAPQASLIALLALPLMGLVGLEQAFRNSDYARRPVMRPLAIGIGILFAVDVFVFSHAVLLGTVQNELWSTRGLASLAGIPFLVLAYKRHPDWEHELFVSRHIVFYTTSIMGAGLYLLAMGIGGSLVGARGGSWGPWFQLLFLVSSGALLFLALFSLSWRRKLKALIDKHFFKNRYDYREEWLRLIQMLAQHDDASAAERSVKALANIIGTEHGQLWIRKPDADEYESHGSVGTPSTVRTLNLDDDLVRFMERTRWIVDTREYAEDPEKYGNAFDLSSWPFETESLLVPIVHEERLMGVMRLDRPRDIKDLSYEDRDLLKTVGQQVAIYLTQELAKEALAETRQLEAFSRLTMFLMHDLKNLITQQELVLSNATRFKDRPEFVEDAFQTIEAGVGRMKKLLERLGGTTTGEDLQRLALSDLLGEIVETCADRRPRPTLSIEAANLWVKVDQDRFASAMIHAVRNAQDATVDDGKVGLRLTRLDNTAVIEVIDSGCGMDADFVSERLFRPFDSTKGAKGMGIGAYQLRETIRSAGGQLKVDSAIGRGTTLVIQLPLVDGAAIDRTRTVA